MEPADLPADTTAVVIADIVHPGAPSELTDYILFKVDLVVNHNVPKCPKTYVHRVGRSARAGRYGSALTFVTQYDVVLLQAVEELIGMKLKELKVSDRKVTRYVTKVLVAKREAELRLQQSNFGERKESNLRKDLLMSGIPEDEVDKRIEQIKNPRRKTIKKSSKEDLGVVKRKKMRIST
ncbi:hypothetical protein Y032_0985g3293 [Ancylostoma ceylanicum]|uniref:Helicase C-terminal domain-containing protein n=1 Tax=Ancylostoma ceylanicum TaxID=53326 RepID=A0A016W9S8_9BILA|nr:hypothetical protein Y032_0985g3293 [Ancylostoma ceylanicum]